MALLFPMPAATSPWGAQMFPTFRIWQAAFVWGYVGENHDIQMLLATFAQAL
jgi:hypothetical protein